MTSDTATHRTPSCSQRESTGSTSHLCSLNPAAGRSRVFKKGDGHRRRTFKSVRTARYRPAATVTVVEAVAEGRAGPRVAAAAPGTGARRRCVNFYRLKQVTPNAPQQQQQQHLRPQLGWAGESGARGGPGAGERGRRAGPDRGPPRGGTHRAESRRPRRKTGEIAPVADAGNPSSSHLHNSAVDFLF
jgi:hypothetical protein